MSVPNLGNKSSILQSVLKDTSAHESSAAVIINTCHDEALSGFKQEYIKILSLIKQSRDNCIVLAGKSDSVGPVASDCTDDDSQTILKLQYQRAEQLLNESARREEEIKLELQKVKSFVDNLHTFIKKGVDLSPNQQKSIYALQASKHRLEKEIEGKNDQISKLNEEVALVHENIEAAEEAKRGVDADISALRVKASAKKSEIDNEMQRKEKVEKDVRHLRYINSQKQQEISTKQFNIAKLLEEFQSTKNQTITQQSDVNALNQTQEELKEKITKSTKDCEDQLKQAREQETKNEKLKAAEKLKSQKLVKQKQDLKKLLKLKDVLISKTRELEEAKAMEENFRTRMRDQNDTILAKLGEKKKSIDKHRKNLEHLKKERDSLKDSLKKTTFESARLSAIIQFQKDQQASLEMDLNTLRKELGTNKSKIAALVTENENLKSESKSLSTQMTDLLSSLKQKELQIFNYRQQTLASETKLLHLQSIYDKLQTERLALVKELAERESESKNLKRAVRDMTFEIAGAKREIEGKEVEIKYLTAELGEFENQTKQLKDEIIKVKEQSQDAQNSLKAQGEEEEKLDKIAKDASLEKSRQEKSVEVVLLEKEKVREQVKEKKRELDVLYQTLRDEKLALKTSEAEYVQVLKMIEDMRKKNLLLRVELSERHDSGEEGIERLRNESIKLQKEINQFKSKITFLEQELHNPINIHRWRKLECSDPETFKMVQLLHTLQRKVIGKNEEMSAKEAAIDEHEKQYLRLKTVLAKQPGPEAVLQLTEFQKVCKEKSAQLGHMDTELNMYKAQVEEYKYDIKVLDKGLVESKKKVMEMYENRSKMLPGPIDSI